MKNIQLKKLELTNYRNIEHAVYEFNGNSKIVGDNRIGKTNTLEAIYYLLTGCLLNGSSEINAIKPLANSRAEVVVSGTFDIDGKEITITKKFGEEWVKQRNTGEEVMKGHYTELWYNGTKQPTTRDYNNLFNEDFGMSQSETVKISFAQMLSNPFYIGEMCETTNWTEVRKLIIELVGDVSDDDVFAKEPMTEILKPELELSNGRIDQVKKKIDGEIKGLKETLIADDGKIEMLSKIDAPSDAEVEGARLKINSINEEIASLRSSTGTNEAEITLKNKIADINIKIADERASASRSSTNEDEISKLIKERNTLFDRKSEVQRKISEGTYKLESQESKITRLENERKDLLDDYHALKDAKVSVETVCPTCKRPLDPSQIEKARQDILDANKTKMDIIVLDGTKLKNQIADEKAVMEQLKSVIAKLEPELDSISKEIADLSSKIENLRAVDSTPKANPELDRLIAEKSKYEVDLLSLQSDSAKAREEITRQIYELDESKKPYQKVLDDYAYSVRQRADKEYCEEEKVEHSKALVKREQMKDMIQKFTFTKLQMLDSNVAKVFGNIKFQLIKENINGGFDTVCKPYIYDSVKGESTSVLWKSGSKSERIVTGIAIAEAIKNKLGLSNMPYLFDEGGELSGDTINTRLQTNAQIICVKVQDNITSPLVLNL